MRPCFSNRKRIVWLALNALEDREAETLRAHLETCEACRRYREEISNVTEQLIPAQAEPDFQSSEAFHLKLVRRLRAEESGTFLETVVPRLRECLLNWRVALPLIGVAAVLIAVLPFSQPRSVVPATAPTGRQVAQAAEEKKNPEPTISNYQWVANRSLEELDELLTRQGNRNPSPIPLYTASTLSRANLSD